MATQEEVAAYLDLTDRSVRELRDKGVFQDNGRGGLDLDDCRIAYIQHLRERAAGRNADQDDTLKRERALLVREQRERIAIKNAVDRRELAPVADMSAAVVSMIEIVKAKLRRLPAKVAKSDSRLKVRISDALEEALDELSLERVEEQLADGGGADEADGE
ncbi:hypothetical protein TSH100_13875 [Azospirillum sp. TSH100]|uniref:hypothetical protein n=1 Tax=Azospirillum sp. TSH100 TaxID=652764 RepID=UPI000D60C916|nr:hypothetical protein [Azospirillum sp. TSH100]PWC86059.1 hypothetical protein TSH100_13875 [Azospirillum sp. TSH100]QCG89366.1 hypothetical protein E6C72_16380 [Azospirillum sp. TSH100]